MNNPSPRFSKGDVVQLRDTGEMGRVVDDPTRDAGEWWYRIQFSMRTESRVEEDLVPLASLDETLKHLVETGIWGRMHSLRCALAVERLEHQNRSTVYSYRSQRIEFQAYQYKPLLKMLDSFDRKLLIADEVGLGKTIEAGIILTEMAARLPLSRILVVCPATLRDKWREELNRKFDQDFQIFTKKSLEEFILHDRDNPRRRPLHGIVSTQSIRNPSLLDTVVIEYGDLDCLIMDEAHDARNPNTQTSKMLRQLCEISDISMLLTATPLHLSFKDLHTLVNALRPTEFPNADVFEKELEGHVGIHKACHLVRSQDSAATTEVCEILKQIFIDGKPIEMRDPIAGQLVSELCGDLPKDRRGWVELERRIQDLHPLASIMTRTRKREVQESAPVRKAAVLKCQFTDDEYICYQRLVVGANREGWIQEKMDFGGIMRARQAASCLPAAMEAKFQYVASADDVAELSDILPEEIGGNVGDLKPPALNQGTLDVPDSKYEKLREVLTQIWDENPDDKVLIFAFFKGTCKYLERQLQKEGISVLRIDGDVPSKPNHPEQDERGNRMRKFREDPNVLGLISTEVGSEGLDFQFCHHLVNYDLPWNPMKVEQRIGRIDRFGQKAEKIFIHNLVVENTVEDRILLRLYDRIGIFERSVGCLEAILGETISDIKREYFNGTLTPADSERRVEQAAQAIERNRLEYEKLEKKSGELFGHDEYIRDEMKRVGRLGRYVSPNAMYSLIKNFLDAKHPESGIWRETNDGICGIRLSESLRQNIHNQAAHYSYHWNDRSVNDELLLTFDGHSAYANPSLELVNSLHPLMRAAVEGISGQLEESRFRIARTKLKISETSDLDLPAGRVFIFVYRTTVTGVRARESIDAVAMHAKTNKLLDGEDAEELLFLATESDSDSNTQPTSDSMPAGVWEALLSEMRRRSTNLRKTESDVNTALYLRRMDVLEKEYLHIRRSREQRIKTLRSRGEERMIPAAEALLQKAVIEYERKRSDLESCQKVSVAISDPPIAVCLVQLID